MAARKDTPEMFEAFKIAAAERKRRAQGGVENPANAVQPAKTVEPTRPAAGKTDPLAPPAPEAGATQKRVAEGASVAKETPPAPTVRPMAPRESVVSRPAPSARVDRPWSQANKGQEAAIYLPLGQRRQIVLSMSYVVAGVLGAALVGLVVLGFVAGMWVGGADSSQPAAGYEAAKTPGQTGQGNANNTPAEPGTTYYVQVVTVGNTELGLRELGEMKTTLESRGYKDIQTVYTNSRKTSISMLVGKFTGPDGYAQAKALTERLQKEPFKGRMPFKEALPVSPKSK